VTKHARWFAVLLLVALAATPAAGGQEKKKPSPKEIKQLTAEGDRLLAAGKRVEARAYYLKVVTDDPTNAPVALKLARLSADAGDWSSTIAAYTIVVTSGQGPEVADAHAGLAAAYVRTSKLQEAAENARKAIALNPSLGEAHVHLAYSLMRMGSDEALAAAEKAAAASPTSALAHATLGEALLSKGDTGEAERAVRRALELDEKLGDAHAALAEVQYRKKDFAGAVASASRALELAPSLSRVYTIRGKAAYAQGRASTAQSDLTMALTVSPNDAEVHLFVARLRRRDGNDALAVEGYRRAMELDPGLGEAHLELGEMLFDKGDLTGARDLLAKGVQLRPEASRGHGLLGMIAEREKQVDAALASYARALELDGNWAEVHRLRGNLLRLEKKDIAGALASLEKAAALKPENPDYLTDLGVTLYDAKQADRAIELLQKAAGTPDYKNPMGHAVLGVALKDRTLFADALGHFEKAAALAPKWWLPHWGAAWSEFGLIKKGCPCGPEDDERVQKMKGHFDQMTGLKGEDPALAQRVEALLKGQKIK
jgi:tetratricopeptide (TPR) repeat protein